MNRIDRKIKNLERKIYKFHKERSAHFNDADEKEYYKINFRLNTARKDLQNLINFQSKHNLTGEAIKPVEVGYGKTRYETLPETTQDKIARCLKLVSGTIYAIPDRDIVVKLADAVHEVSKSSHSDQKETLTKKDTEQHTCSM